jgi:hypothetical protein
VSVLATVIEKVVGDDKLPEPAVVSVTVKL